MVQMMGVGKITSLLWDEVRAGMYVAEKLASTDTLSLLEKIRAACAVRADALVPRPFSQTERCFDLRTFDPLKAAVSTENANMTRMYLNDAKARNSLPSVDELGMLPALEDACFRGHDAQVEVVVSYLQESGQFSKSVYDDVLGITIVTNHTAWMRKILDMCPPDTKQIATQNFVLACNTGIVAVVSMATSALDDINSGRMENFPLHHAIATGRSEVGAVLDAGANLNNTAYTSDYNGRVYLLNSPLGYALRLNLTAAAIAYLIERGALVPPVDTWGPQRKERYAVLQAAILAQTGETVMDWEETPAGIQATVEMAVKARRKAKKAEEAAEVQRQAREFCQSFST